MIYTYLARVGLFASIFVPPIVLLVHDPMSTAAMIAVGLSVIIGGFIFYDRWVK